VVLAAGSIGSAQLLMVSGVGPKANLRDVGVHPVVDLPVGYNLQDHVTFSGNAFLVNESNICVNDVSKFLF
jgi:choline dehydrogenase